MQMLTYVCMHGVCVCVYSMCSVCVCVRSVCVVYMSVYV